MRCAAPSAASSEDARSDARWLGSLDPASTPSRRLSRHAGLAAEANDDKAKSSSKSGSSGGKDDKFDKQKDVDTEHLFGFTEGSDAGEKGEQEVVVDTISRLSKRRKSYAGF